MDTARYHINRTPWPRQWLLFPILLVGPKEKQNRAAAFDEYLGAEHLLQKHEEKLISCDNEEQGNICL